MSARNCCRGLSVAPIGSVSIGESDLSDSDD